MCGKARGAAGATAGAGAAAAGAGAGAGGAGSRTVFGVCGMFVSSTTYGLFAVKLR
jgi:hypothetical protein